MILAVNAKIIGGLIQPLPCLSDVDLMGQGQTLLEQIGKGTLQPKKEISYETQLALVKALQEKLNVTKVSIGGISYGGGLAAAYAREFPEKVSHALLIAPYVMSYERQSPGTQMLFGAMLFNPFGRALYEQQSKALLRAGINKVPAYLESHRNDFHDTVYGLSKGIQFLDLRDVATGIQVPVHILKATSDSVVFDSSIEGVWRALPKSSQASKDALPGVHDLVGTNPKESAAWMVRVLGE